MSHPTFFDRRQFLLQAAALPLLSGAARPRPGCQANAWELDPARFDLLLTALKEIKELGFAGYETNIRFLQPQLSHVADAQAELKKHQLTLIGAHTSLPAYETEGLDKAADQVARLAEQAARFSATSLVVSHKGLAEDGRFTPAALQAKVQMLNAAGRRCREHGLTLAYHNHQPEFRANAAEARALVRDTDPAYVHLLLDIGWAWCADPTVVGFFREHHRRIFGMHIRDFRDGVSVPLGQGSFPLPELARAGIETGWSGWLIDEEERPNQPKPGKAATGPSRETMRRVFGV